MRIASTQSFFIRPTLGLSDACVMVLCEPQTPDAANQRKPMEAKAKTFLDAHIKRAEMPAGMFQFIALCPPIPEEIQSSAKKTWDYVSAHIEGLDQLIAARKPRMIVPIGNLALRAIMGKPMAIMKNRGIAVEHNGNLVFPLLSPDLVMNMPEHEPIFAGDLGIMKKIIAADFDRSLIRGKVAAYEWCWDLQALIDKKPKFLSIDTEGTGLKWYRPETKVLTIQLTPEPGRTLVCPIHPGYRRRWFNDTSGMHGTIKLRDQLRQLLSNPDLPKVAHNLKFVHHMLREEAIDVKGWAHDTQLLAFAVDENMQNKDLDDCVKRWVPSMAGYGDHFNAMIDKSRMIDLQPEDEFDNLGNLVKPGMRNHAGSGPDAVFRLAQVLVPLLRQDPSQYNCYRRIMMPGIMAFATMVEVYGQHIDRDYLRNLESEIRAWTQKDYSRLIKMIPAAVRRKHLERYGEDGLKFSRDDFMRDVLFSQEGFKLKPKVWTDTTAHLPEAERVASVSTKQHMPYFSDLDGIAGEFVRGYIEYQKAQKLLSTYIGEEAKVTGFWKYISNEGRIHPSYMLHRTNTGRTACLTGDTLITVLDPRGQVPIKDMRAGDWVWSFGDDLLPVPAMVSWSGQTMCVRQLVEVTFLTQDSRNQVTIRCTPDHPFRVRSGQYLRADELVEGSRLLSVERSVHADGYRRVYFTGCHGKSPLEHVMVADAIKGLIPYGYDVHHDNEVKNDNRPCNLIPLAPSEYAHVHGWTPEQIEKRQIMRQRYRGAFILKRRMPFGRTNPRWYDIDASWALPVLKPARYKPTLFRDIYGMDYACVSKKLRCLAVDWRVMRDREKIEARATKLSEARMADNIHTAARILAVNYSKAKALLASDYNHVVTSARLVEVDETPVYDLTVPGSHNFIANGVCVHNSADPNGQNIPKRGDFAKSYRKAFRAAPGFRRVDADLNQIELRLIAWMAREEEMLRVYATGGDIHTETGRATNRMTLEQWGALSADDGEVIRFKAKAVNFGFVYGMQWRGFKTYAKTQYGVEYSDSDAQETRQLYFNKYKGLIPWHQRMKALAHKHGYVRAMHGAIRRLPSIWSNDESIVSMAERQAVNAPIQRMGSDLGVIAASILARHADPEILRPIGFIHDCLACEAREGYEEDAAKAIKWIMQNIPLKRYFGIEPPIPIIADAEVETLVETDGRQILLMQKRKNIIAEVPWFWKDHVEEDFENHLIATGCNAYERYISPFHD